MAPPPVAQSSSENVLARRLCMFTMKALKNPIEIHFKNNKIGTGVLQSIDPDTFDFVVAGFSTHGEKEKVTYRRVLFEEIFGFTVFNKNWSNWNKFNTNSSQSSNNFIYGFLFLRSLNSKTKLK